MSKKIDLTGRRFGHLTVISEAGRDKCGNALWLCRCDCGNKKEIRGRSLKSGSVLSCGCLMRERASKRITERNITHGLSKTRLYKIWGEMLRRCKNPNAANYSLYGGRGIRVCERWEDFKAFYEDMHAGFKKGLSLDRIDVHGNYCKENCRWATSEEQAQNRRNTIVIDGMSLRKFCRKNGISYDMAYQRVSNGCSVEKAVSEPNKRQRRRECIE